MSARRSAASLAIFCLFGIALFHTLGCGSSSPANTTSPSVPSSAAKNLYYLNQVTVNNTTTSTANIIPITATGSPTPTSYNLPSTYNSGYFAFDGSGNLYVAASTSTTRKMLSSSLRQGRPAIPRPPAPSACLSSPITWS